MSVGNSLSIRNNNSFIVQENKESRVENDRIAAIKAIVFLVGWILTLLIGAGLLISGIVTCSPALLIAGTVTLIANSLLSVLFFILFIKYERSRELTQEGLELSHVCQEEIDDIKRQVESAGLKLAILESEIRDLDEAKSKVLEEIDVLILESHKKLNQVESMKRNLSSLNMSIKNAMSEREKLLEENNNLEEQIRQSKDILEQLLEKVNALKKVVIGLTEQKKQLKEKMLVGEKKDDFFSFQKEKIAEKRIEEANEKLKILLEEVAKNEKKLKSLKEREEEARLFVRKSLVAHSLEAKKNLDKQKASQDLKEKMIKSKEIELREKEEALKVKEEALKVKEKDQ